MPIVKCNATGCKHNENSQCIKDTVDILDKRCKNYEVRLHITKKNVELEIDSDDAI
ncbi:MAG: DUF1540 domain-containing protein [Bacillota bacterium]